MMLVVCFFILDPLEGNSVEHFWGECSTLLLIFGIQSSDALFCSQIPTFILYTYH